MQIHMGMDIYAKQIAPRDTRGHLGGFRESTIQKSGEAVRLARTLVHVCGFIWENSGNGHRLNTSHPSTRQVAFLEGGGVRVSQIKKSGEGVKRLDRLAPNLAHICRSIWEWIYAKQIAPRDTRGGGHLGGFRGQTFKSIRKLSNGWTDWHQLGMDTV